VAYILYLLDIKQSSNRIKPQNSFRVGSILVRGILAIVAMRPLPQGSIFENAWHIKDYFTKFEAFLKIMIIFEDIFREIEAFFWLF
jgi:hypothetical protein